MERFVTRLFVLVTVFLICIPTASPADDIAAAAAVDSSGAAVIAPAIDSSAETPLEAAESTEAEAENVLLPAEPVEAATPAGGEKAGTTTNTEIPITLDEVKTLLTRNEAPRIKVTNRYGGVIIGRAVEIVSDKLNVDVSGEALGVDGIVGVPVAQIVSMQALVPLSDQERAAAEKATAEYIAGISAAQAQVPQQIESTAPEGFPPAAIAAIESSEEGLAESTSAEAQGAPEGERDLLAIYPPSEGWGPEKLGEIIRKSIVLHLHPFGKELDFTNDYDSWKEAYEKKRAEQIAEMTQLQDAGRPVPEGFEVLPELAPVPSLEGAEYAPSAPAGDKSAAPAAGMPAPSAGQ